MTSSARGRKNDPRAIRKRGLAIWQTDYPVLTLADWAYYSEPVKKMYYKRAKAAIKAYKACLKEGL